MSSAFIIGQLALATAAIFTGAAVYINVFTNWPYTLLGVLPVNKRLETTPPQGANAESRGLIEMWGKLHAGRSALGVAATLAYLWAAT